ncbi:MAG: DUF3047 domain-containing protein [Deltaproteobacteria bacterium]|nr:DUF3047 domain-containing protein [Deltaproteobacteria bacterium]
MPTFLAANPPEFFSVDDIARSSVGSFPKDWTTYPFQKYKAKQVYRVTEESGLKFIRAEDKSGLSVVIFKDFDWNIEKYPYLKFKWRAQNIPEGSREDKRETNDSACGVYVGFGRFSALKYVWSASLPVGYVWNKKPGQMLIITKKSGSQDLGEWNEVSINVPKDFQKYYGKKIDRLPSGIAILTDGNAVQSPSACDYRDFRISTQP